MFTHKNHDFEPLDEATEQAKSRLEETEGKVRERAGVWREQINKDQETHRKTKEQLEEARKAIRANTQRCIELAKRLEHELLTQLDTIQEDQERKFQNQKENSERLSHLNSVTDYLVSMSQRGIGEEMLRAEQPVLNRTEEIFNASVEFRPLKNVFVDYKRDEDIYQRFEHSPLGQVHVEFAEPDKTQIDGLATNRIERYQQVRLTVITKDSENNICYSASQEVSVQILSLSGEDVQTEVRDVTKNGTYNVCFTACTVGIHHLTVRVRGQCTANSPLEFRVYERRPLYYEKVATFEPPAWTERKPGNINCISVNSKGEVAVSDCRKHNVQRFTDDGKHLHEFGNQGKCNNEFDYPTGIAHNKDGNIIVADSGNCRIKVYEPSGWWIRMFGEEVLKSPRGVSVTKDDNIVVCDTQEEKVSVFSLEGVLLQQFAPSQGTPSYAIFHDNKFFVSVNSATSHMVQVFDSRGSHLYNIDRMSGGWGNGESLFTRGALQLTKMTYY